MQETALAELRRRVAGGARLASPRPDSLYYAGLETRLPGEAYHWDGRKRGGDPKHPHLLLQITLHGAGCYVGMDGTPVPVPEGVGFFAVLPSAHRYLLPPDAGADWSFFWLILRHAYVVTRLAARLSETGPIWNFGESAEAGALQEQAAQMALLGETVRDPLELEAALFDFLIACERAARTKRHGGAEQSAARETLLTETRRFVQNHLAAPIGVPDLARVRGMERSRFSHYFRAVTGETPARFMTRVRLEAAAAQLAETDATLGTVATETGFADANHLCKVFRRHYHLSPGAYRKQMR